MMGDDLLRGEKIHLTAVLETDLDRLTDWFSSDFEMLRRLGVHPFFPLTRQDEDEWLQRIIDDHSRFTFAIRSLAEDELLGIGSLIHVDWRSRHAELGITLGAQRGQGYGSDAVRVLLRYGFMELNLHRVYLMVHGDNPRAIKSYEKVGFVHEGAVREALLREGRYVDIIRMSVLASEWRAI